MGQSALRDAFHVFSAYFSTLEGPHDRRAASRFFQLTELSTVSRGRFVRQHSAPISFDLPGSVTATCTLFRDLEHEVTSLSNGGEAMK